MRKEQKMKWCLIPVGKNRSYVKINLSVLQRLLHKPEQKEKNTHTQKNLCEMLFPYEAIFHNHL